MKTILTLLVLGTVVFAKPSSNIALSNSMLEVMNKNGYMDVLINQAISQEIASNPLLSTNKRLVSDFAKKYLSFKSLKPQLARIYARELSKDELIAFTKFCRTKEGQSIILKMPRLMNISSYVAQKRIEQEYPKLINSLLGTHK